MVLGQLQSFVPLQEHDHYHDAGKFGFFSILSNNDHGKKQHSYPLSFLPKIRTLIDPRKDTYISQGEFYKPNRLLVNLARLGLLFLDLDYYNQPELKDLTPQQVAGQVLEYCNFEGIPEPSAIVSSGRGVYLKWYLIKPVPAKALPRWNAIMGHLVALFSKFSADTRAKDACRVLRLEGTTNERTGEIVRVIYQSGQIHDFEDLAREILPACRKLCLEHRQKKNAQSRLQGVTGKGNATALQKLSPYQLNWDRLHDLRTLAELRGGVEIGYRDTFLFLATCFVSWFVVDAYGEIGALCHEFSPGLSLAEAHSYTSTAIARAQDAHAGILQNYQGMEVDPRYRFRNQTLIDWLQITSSEERQMKTIISEPEAAERHRERNRKQVTRADYLARAEDRKNEVLQRRAKGESQRQIASTMGISRGAVEYYLRS